MMALPAFSAPLDSPGDIRRLAIFLHIMHAKQLDARHHAQRSRYRGRGNQFCRLLNVA